MARSAHNRLSQRRRPAARILAAKIAALAWPVLQFCPVRAGIGAGFVLFSIAAASAFQVGDTRDRIVAQHGAPTEENHLRHTAVYRQGNWRVDVTYDGNVARTLAFTKLDILNEQEITAILAQNSDAGPWRELRVSGSVRLWQGANFAQAKCERVNPRTLTLYRGVISPATAGTSATGPAQQTASAPVRHLSAPVTPTPTPSRVSDAVIRQMAMSAVATLFSGTIILSLIVALVLRFMLPWVIRNYGKAPAQIVTASRAALLAGTPDDLQSSSGFYSADEPAAEPSLDSIGWENFELLMGELYRRKGYEVEIGAGLGPDGGKDLVLRRNGRLVVVQCKNLARANRVTAAQMRDFFGLVTAERAARGIFATTGYFSADARKFAEGKPIKLLERGDIEAMMRQLALPGEQLCNVRSWIDTFATHAHVADPVCPFCQSPMQLRRGALGKPFWGCSRYGAHRCKGKRDGRQALLAALQWQRR